VGPGRTCYMGAGQPGSVTVSVWAAKFENSSGRNLSSFRALRAVGVKNERILRRRHPTVQDFAAQTPMIAKFLNSDVSRTWVACCTAPCFVFIIRVRARRPSRCCGRARSERDSKKSLPQKETSRPCSPERGRLVYRLARKNLDSGGSRGLLPIVRYLPSGGAAAWRAHR
jgi:hypothetical protein